MARTLSDHLLNTLEELVPYDFEKFKFKLQNTNLEKDHFRIPRGHLQMARPVKLATLLITHYGEEYAVQLTLQTLRAINQRLLAEQLHKATGPEHSTRESENDASTGSSGNNTLQTVKDSDIPEGDGSQQSGDGDRSSILPASQPESGKRPQRKPVAKSKDQKGPEALDWQSRLPTKDTLPPSRRTLALTQAAGDKQIKASAPLRRNVSSAGRLQGLCGGTPGRKESKKSELYLPSGKKRPKSLEITISPEERGPSNLALLTEEEPRTGNPGISQDKAVCRLCHTQEGDWQGGTCVHHFCSCPLAPGDSTPSDRHASRCLQCKASLVGKSSGDHSSQPLPQCPRHANQVQLLFCEDHREPICLICRLSQEHRGHRVRPIEEAALEYKEQIQKQLERLRSLRRCGEEHRLQGDEKKENFLKQAESQKQRVQSQLEKLYEFLEQQKQIFVTWLQELGQTIGRVQETYSTSVAQDIKVLDELIGELEAKQGQSEWKLMQDIEATLNRAKMVTSPESWATPPDIKEKMHLLFQKSELVEKSMQCFSETLRSEMGAFNVPGLTGAQEHATTVLLDPMTAHPNLIFSDDMRSVRLGNKWDRLPDNPERFESCIVALGSPSFFSGRQYWEVEVGDKTSWVLGVCRASASRKGSITLSPENGFWVVMMMKQNEYQASAFPPIRLQMKEPLKRVGIFLDHTARNISFYNVTARSHIYTFTGFSSSGNVQPIFSPGTHNGGKNVAPLTICPVDTQKSH